MHVNYEDYQVYNGKDKLHGLKFLSLAFPCGICIHYGQWTGNRHDAGALHSAQVSCVCMSNVVFTF